MIRVNLLNSKVHGASQEDFEFEVPSGGASSERLAVLNFVLFVGFVLALVIYENSEKTKLQEKSVLLQQELAQVDTQVQQKKMEVEKSKNALKELEELKVRAEKLKKLSQSRLNEIKALDYLQTVIPERIWLDSIRYRNKKVFIKGFAVTDSDLTDFLKALEAKPYYQDVILLKATESKSDSGSVKSFEISSVLGVNG